MKRRWLVLGLSLSLSVALASDVHAEVQLGLEEALERAHRSSASIRALEADLRAAEAGIDVARAERKPDASISASYSRRSSGFGLTLLLPDGSSQVIFPDIVDWWQSRVGGSFALYAGGRLPALVEAAQGDADALRADRESAALDLDFEVTSAYLRLLTARETDRVLARSVEALEAHLADARNRERVGLAARNEVLAVEVERDRVELNRIRAVHTGDLAEADLARLVDLAPGERIVPADTLGVAAIPALEVEALVAEALAKRPERGALEARRAAASSRVEIERAARRPQLLATGGLDYSNPNIRVLPLRATWNDSWDVGVGFSFSLFDGGQARASQARAAERVTALDERLADLERRIRLDVVSRILEARNAQAALPVSERAIASATENLRVTRDRYREGLDPSSDLLDAEVELERAELERTETLVELRLALAGLDRAVGR